MYVLKLPRGQLLYSVWLIIDRLPSHRHRHGDNLPVIRRHLPRLIRARKESNPQRGQRGEPPPQQLGHDPHLCSHERWDTDKECCFFYELFVLQATRAHDEHLCACLCFFKTCSAVLSPLHLSSGLCVCAFTRKKPLSIILLFSAVPLPACISLSLAYISLASWKFKCR